MKQDDTKTETRGLLEETLASPPFLLALLGEAVLPRLSAAHAALELTPRRFQLLLLLHDKGAMSQSDVHQAMGIDPSALVQLLDPLEAMGLIARRREAADRRRHVVSLTAAGERRLVEALEAQHELEEELLRAHMRAAPETRRAAPGSARGHDGLAGAALLKISARRIPDVARRLPRSRR